MSSFLSFFERFIDIHFESIHVFVTYSTPLSLFDFLIFISQMAMASPSFNKFPNWAKWPMKVKHLVLFYFKFIFLVINVVCFQTFILIKINVAHEKSILLNHLETWKVNLRIIYKSHRFSRTKFVDWLLPWPQGQGKYRENNTTENNE